MLDCEFRFVSFTEGLGQLRAGGFSRPTATITFDDVEETAFTNALPVLDRFGIQAILYIASDYARTGSCYRTTGKPAAMSVQQIIEAVRMGHEVGGHTITHAPVKYCTEPRVRQELCLSKKLLEEWCRCEIRHFSYPWGQHSRWTRSLLANIGLYESAATIERGMMFGGEAPFAIRRDSICPRLMSPDGMVRTMAMADLWYWLARLKRRMKKRNWRNLESWSQLSDTQLKEITAS
jgi:peptidoglycan/xylan/chitin deacetylase (PgdA/CDA1 family)